MRGIGRMWGRYNEMIVEIERWERGVGSISIDILWIKSVLLHLAQRYR